MVQRKTIVTALSGVLVGGLLLSGGLAIAGDASSTVSDNLAGKMPFIGKVMKGGMGKGGRLFKGGRQGGLQLNLDQLVKDGVITQAKADEIKAFIDKAATSETKGRGRQNLMSELVSNKILTQEQADTIQAKLKEAAQKQKQQQLSDSLKAVVEKGTITQEQSDKIVKAVEDAEKEHAALDQKMENMTLKEIRQYMQDNKGKTQNPIDKLVSDKVITQEQVAAIRQSMNETAQKQHQQQLADRLKALVDKGTITQEQSDKILKKIEDVQKEREALAEKIKNMTAEERRQYMQDNKGKIMKQDPVSQLVADGTITQEQADAIGKVFPFQKGFKGGPGGFRGGPGGFRGEFGGEFRGGRH